MKRLMVIDDEPLVIKGIEAMLKKIDTVFEFAGFAHDGNSAVTRIHELNPDVVLIDIRMPGKDGLAVIEEVQKKHPDIIFVLISAYKEFEYARRGMKLGVRDYIEKPITRKKLSDLLEKMDSRQGPEEIILQQRQQQEALRAELKAGKQALRGKVEDSRSDGWREELTQTLTVMKEVGIDLDTYRGETYQMVSGCADLFYEKWKYVEKEFHFPLLSNMEQLENYEEVDEFLYIYFEYLFKKVDMHWRGVRHKGINEILSYVDLHYADDFGLNEMAQMLNVTSSYLSILFKEEVGETFVKYLTKVRMEHAKQFLLAGMKVGEVSKRVGYGSYRYFSNIFKAETGYTPNEYKGHVRSKK